MTRFTFSGQHVDLPAVFAPRAPSRDETAWLHGQRQTVRLVARVEALRAHTAGRSFPGRDASHEAGAWLLIGDVIATASQLASSRSLPVDDPGRLAAFTHVSEAILAPGAILNIGLASKKFGGSGGAFQAEFVSGPPIIFRPLFGKHWHDATGHA